MSNLNNFAQFQIEDNSINNVEGGTCRRRRRSSGCYSYKSYNTCDSYNSCDSYQSYNNCQPKCGTQTPEVIVEEKVVTPEVITPIIDLS